MEGAVNCTLDKIGNEISYRVATHQSEELLNINSCSSVCSSASTVSCAFFSIDGSIPFPACLVTPNLKRKFESEYCNNLLKRLPNESENYDNLVKRLQRNCTFLSQTPNSNDYTSHAVQNCNEQMDRGSTSYPCHQRSSTTYTDFGYSSAFLSTFRSIPSRDYEEYSLGPGNPFAPRHETRKWNF